MILPHSLSRFRAFTLTECLLVLGIIGLLGTLLAPSLGSLGTSWKMDSSLLAASSVLEQARQYAVSKNTYVWVLFNEPEMNDASNELTVAVVASRSGTDTLGWPDDKIILPAANQPASDIEIVVRGRRLSAARIADRPSVNIGSLPKAGAAEQASLASLNIEIGPNGNRASFTRAVQFTPTGEARASGAIVRYIDLTMLPLRGEGGGDSPNQAVLRIGGLTGKTLIYRN